MPKIPPYKPLHINRSVKQPGSLRLTIPPDIFAQIVAWTADSRPSETSGWGWVEDGVLVDVYRNKFATEVGGGVTWSMAEIMAECDMRGKAFCNFQWHSHPGFMAFFSGTDDKSNDLLLNDLFAAFESGEFYIAVEDGGMEGLVRKYMWQRWGEDVQHEDGCFELLGVPLEPRKQMWYGGAWSGAGNKEKTKADDQLGQLFSGELLPLESPWTTREDGWNILTPREEAVLDHNMFFDTPPGSEVDGVYLFYSSQEERAYMGDWSDNREDYFRLFEIFKVQPYNWEELFDAVEEEFPDQYYLIVSDPQIGWEMLAKYFKKQEEEFVDGHANSHVTSE